MERISSRTRQRRVVNYRQFEDSDDDSEDDFARRPPAKKAREEKKKSTSKSKEPQPSKSSAPTNTATANGSAPKERLSRDDKQFNRELQQALDASLQQPQSQSSEGGTGTVKSEDKSEKENDGDFCLEGEEAENSDYSDGEDSDFDASPQPKKGKGKTQKNEQAKTKKTNSKERGGSTKSVGSRGVGKKTHPTPSLPARAPATPTILREVEATRKPSLPGNQKTPALGARRMPKWTPPARVSPGGENTNFMRTKSSTISSGSGSPAIRVGLSRNARVKPLHSGVSISNT